MGRAARRKRANGGPGFFRQAHLLAAVEQTQATARGQTPPTASSDGRRAADTATADEVADDGAPE